jgi:predicted ATP-grasp superfamily ATP-dependent carboligase
MLSALLDDFMRWGKLTVYTTLDKRLGDTPLTADRITIVTPHKYKETFSSLLKECDLALIIAPETDDLLAGLIMRAEDSGVRTLGSTPAAIRSTGDKWECHKKLFRAGLPLPETTIVEMGLKPVSADRYYIQEAALKIGFPLVIKPVDGVGCEGVNLVKDMNTLCKILEDDDPIYTDKLIIQKYTKGEHLSVSILSTGNEFVILSLNRQHITEGTPFRYLGGEIMPPPDKGDDLHNIVKKIIEVIPGLKGYFGVDLVKGISGYKVIEINPRLTTSYTGLRKVININLAEAIYNAVTRDRLPEGINIRGNLLFWKE